MLNSKAYTEVYYLINEMSEELRMKIPEKILKNIENRMDKEYEFDVEDDDLENIELLEDTEKILSVIYTDYLATDEEREVILNKEKILSERNKKVLPEIQIHEIFSDKQANMNVQETNLVEVSEEKWYKKLFNWIKRCLKIA